MSGDGASPDGAMDSSGQDRRAEAASGCDAAAYIEPGASCSSEGSTATGPAPVCTDVAPACPAAATCTCSQGYWVCPKCPHCTTDQRQLGCGLGQVCEGVTVTQCDGAPREVAGHCVCEGPGLVCPTETIVYRCLDAGLDAGLDGNPDVMADGNPDALASDAGDDAAYGACFGADGSVASSLKACPNGDSDCTYFSHQLNCCGSMQYVGIAKSSAAQVASCEATWEAHFPACGCASTTPTTEDGKPDEDGAAPSVHCVGSGLVGTCRTSLP